MGLYETVTGGHDNPVGLCIHWTFVLPYRVVRWGYRKARWAWLRRQGWTDAE